MPMTMKLEGLQNMQNHLAQLQQLVREDATRKAVRAGANIIRDEMKAQAKSIPAKTERSTSLEPGALREDIRVSMTRIDKQGFIMASIGPDLTQHVARWVEYGHRLIRRGKGLIWLRVGGGGTGRIVANVPAHPFLRPAFEASEQPSLAAFVAEMKRQLARYLS